MRKTGTAGLISVSVALLLSGCGQTGQPLPPSLKIPAPVSDLHASRSADVVHLTWTMPRHTTDKLALVGSQQVSVCRQLSNSTCQPIGEASFPPEKPASFEDHLPSALTAGPVRLLAYFIEVKGPRARSAGESNPAYTVAGAAPPALGGFKGQPTANGVLLSWQPEPVSNNPEIVRIHRVLISALTAQTDSSDKLGPHEKSLLDQTLAVKLASNADPGKAIDTDAAFNQIYRYTAARVATTSLDGHSLEVNGADSEPVVVNTLDRFPPATPRDLAAVAVPEQAAIDLTWTPDTEPDLAGYLVYRRNTDNDQPAKRITPAGGPSITPAFHDSEVQPGHTYAYSVSAVDRRGNESSRSAEVTVRLEPKL